MRNKLILSVGAALLIGGIVGFALGNIHSHHSRDRGEKMSDRHGTFINHSATTSDKRSDPRMGMVDHTMHNAMMVQSEQAFIEGMVPHHEEAVSTAQEVLARGGTTPEIRTLAENIITSQTKEINDMKAWYETWYNNPYAPASTSMAMMRELKDLSGVKLDRAFLEDMIKHHQGAIMMTNSIQSYLEHEELRTLTKKITDSQTQEITTMQTLLSTLP